MSEGDGTEASGETVKEKTVGVEWMMQALRNLNASSTGMTKLLDDEYYALLERLAALRIRALALERVAKSMCDGYTALAGEVRSVEDEISGQLSTMADLDQREAVTARYVSLIRQADEKIRTLEGRVRTVRKRIDKWEDADRAWQERTRKRLKIFWSVTFFVATVVIAFAVGVKYAGARLNAGGGSGGGSGGTTAPPPGRRLNTPRAATDGGGRATSRALPWKTAQAGGGRLGAFDEL